jgi:hypothetical protein
VSGIHDRNLTTCPLCGERVVLVASVSQGGAHVSASHAPPTQGCPLVERLRAMIQSNAVTPIEEQAPLNGKAN